MPLPTMSLRAPPEHHQLIRDIATALRTRPELEDALRNVLQTQRDGIADCNTDVLQPILERLEDTRDFTRRIMAFAENINERVKALEQPEALRNTDVLQSILDRLAALEEREPRMVKIDALEARVVKLEELLAHHPPAMPKPAPNRHIPLEYVEEAVRLWDGGKGPSFKRIVASKGWPYNFNSLGKAVKKYLERPQNDHSGEC